MSDVLLHLPLPHQRLALLAPSRFKVLCWGRRCGKTEGVGLTAVVDGHGPRIAGQPIFSGALHGGTIWWVTKTSGVASLIWRALKETLRGSWIKINEVERRIDLDGVPCPGSITVKSGDEPDSLRGPGLDGLVIDEAAYCPGEVWDVMRPALADRRGWAIFISTPNYKKSGAWFEDLYVQAPARGWYRERRPTSDNPKIPSEEIEQARREMAPLLFRQEYLAEFIRGSGAIIKADWFRYYRTRTGDGGSLAYELQADDGIRVASGTEGLRYGTADLAVSLKTSADYTAIASCLATGRRDLLVLGMDRRRLEGPDQLPAIERAIAQHRLGAVWIERAGYQLSLIQAAVRRGLPVRELAADRDKLSRSMPLQARMAAGAVFFPEGAPWVPELEAELLSFTGEPDGRRTDGLQAEGDYHDDQVDALSYAAQVLAQPVPSVRALV